MTVGDLITLLKTIDDHIIVATTTIDGVHKEVSHVNVEVCVGIPGVEGEPVVTIE